jgi:hypothetical protein
MISPTQVDKASLEEILANCEYFSVGLLKLSEQLRSLLLVLEDLQLEVDKRPAGKSWSWLRFSWWPSRREQVIQDSDEGKRIWIDFYLELFEESGPNLSLASASVGTQPCRRQPKLFTSAQYQWSGTRPTPRTNTSTKRK